MVTLYPLVLAFLVVALIVFGFPTSRDEVHFKYTPYGGDDQIDQVLEIENTGLHAIRPTLKITPLDLAGQEIPGLTVTTAFGSDRGQQVIAAEFTDFDILHFEGERANEVRKVRVEITKLKQADYPDMTEGVSADRFEAGRKVDQFNAQFDAIQLHNPNDDALAVNVVLIAWARAKKGDPQQFEWAIPIGDPVTVPAHDAKMVPLPGDLADISYVSVKTYSATS
jgi:hypothetical protein